MIPDEGVVGKLARRVRGKTALPLLDSRPLAMTPYLHAGLPLAGAVLDGDVEAPNDNRPALRAQGSDDVRHPAIDRVVAETMLNLESGVGKPKGIMWFVLSTAAGIDEATKFFQTITL